MDYTTSFPPRQKRTLAICRQGVRVELPCNWVKDGICGSDMKPCRIDHVIE